MRVIVGLGNPGRRYDKTRHNVGFLVIERLAERWIFESINRSQFGALVGDGLIGLERALLVRPQSFMNASGQPVATAAGFHRVPPRELVVIHDDMDLPFGAVRCKTGGGHGGHNGLRDISRVLGPEFIRVRVGVGRPPEGWAPADYVLGKWSASEEQALAELIDGAADAAECILRDGTEAAMNRFNVRPSRPDGRPEVSPVAASGEAMRSRR